uniref:PDZ domain-containing protein n=1 Tax=Zooxanthella nutricula TaxID=1333877 RepID=A0A7S2KZE9_9DINO
MGEQKVAKPRQKPAASPAAKKPAASAPAAKGSAAQAASKSKGNDAQAPSEAWLARFRPKPNPLFFALFASGCIWILALYQPCVVKGTKRDCGYSGISTGTCRTLACFIKSPGPYQKKKLKVKRADGESLGLALEQRPDAYVVQSLQPDGAASKHNSELASGSEDMVLPGDRLVKIGSSSGKDMAKELKGTSAKTVALEIQRSRLPRLLQFLHSGKTKPNLLETLLSAPGLAHFSSLWQFMAMVAMPGWFISGYPLSSLPAYFTMSAAVAFQLTRCCHDEKVPEGVPHCYQSNRESMPKLLRKVWSDTSALAAAFTKDPRAHLEWAFLPGK